MRWPDANGSQMLKSAIETETGTRPDVFDLVYHLKDDVRLWAKAEMELAQLELRDLRSRAIRGLVLVIVGFAAAFCTLVILSQAAIALLTPYVENAGYAALIVAIALICVAALCMLGLRRAATWDTESMFFRWLRQRPSPTGFQ